MTNIDKSKLISLLKTVDPSALVSITDAKGIILYVNDKFAKISKYKKSQLVGQNHRILKSRHQPDELFDILWQDISAGKKWRGNIKNKAKDGSFFWVDTTITPVIGLNGRPEFFVAIRYLIADPE
jgi:PAS domain S-box-containing protein